jgi:hypothetical protein
MGMRTNLRVFALFVILVPQLAFGWGATGHKIVARIGSGLSKTESPFWRANWQGMVEMTNVPDKYWKALPTRTIETPTHYFHADAYYTDPGSFHLIPRIYSQAVAKYTKDFVDSNGTAVWRIQQFYDMGVAAIKRQDFKTALQAAGVMSHYLGDTSQPLHNTENYDGQLTNQKGIHKFFETTNLDANDLQSIVKVTTQQAQSLLKNPAFLKHFDGPLIQVIFNEMTRAYKVKDRVLRIDKEQGREGQGAVNQLKIAISRMADGSATLTLILDRMWMEAGNPPGGSTISVDVPPWAPPRYRKQLVNSYELLSISHDDDCLDEAN